MNVNRSNQVVDQPLTRRPAIRRELTPRRRTPDLVPVRRGVRSLATPAELNYVDHEDRPHSHSYGKPESRSRAVVVLMATWLALFLLGCFWIRRKPLSVVPLPIVAALIWSAG